LSGWLLCWLSQIIKCNIGSARPAALPSYTITPRNSPTFGTQIPIRYNSDHKLAEAIVSKAAERHTLSFQDLTEQAVQELERRYSVKREQIRPTIYYRLTDNWLELTVRFITPYYGTRELKDAISRDILGGFKEAGIDIASSTHDIVGLPPVRLEFNAFGAK
jgi:hypothetical protein